LALIGCFSAMAFAQGPKTQIVDPQFPEANMSGSEIHNEVHNGVYTNPNDSGLSFRNESLFIIRKDTGMSPNVPARGVRTPVIGLGIAPAAGSWSFTLTDVATRHLKLNLYQTADAVFGSGELMDNGITTQVTAGGTVLGDGLSLYVTPIGTQNLYRFSLEIKPGSMDGDYVFTAPGITQPGVAFGSLIAPQGAVPLAPQAAQALPASQTLPASAPQIQSQQDY
jgi:hypothetical protein